MIATVLDSEGVTLIDLIEVPDACRVFGIRLLVKPRLSLALSEPDAVITPRETVATFEQVRGDGVAVFRRNDA